ncbi:hypothetical protein JGH11_08810 [Dysgonomonas sp. Marseille-P4677]|uniref:hypothetical protein n=1 Tax=Dysgonomonas sp. Marseille-P4677 TaxID=2364790 RepID=UPI0019116E74|nr:hypothetical protein [Dysgonomonas sp. Marseille-P4677]MBK5720970.1 hypothetical protein [Dysgonomonas sp. Marseille-P4677]
MFQALFYKEWIKSRRLIFLIGIVLIGAIIYSFINIAQTFRVEGSIQAWSDVILKDIAVLPAFFQWLPILIALTISFTQFIPEMTNKRLKLTLHLPVPESKTIATMLCYGLCVLLIIYLATYLVLMIGLSFYFPFEIRVIATWRLLPWFAAGITGYLLAAWICIEPVWRQRICNTFISICILSLFFIKAQSGAYLPLLPFLLIIMIVCFGNPFYSSARFKEGKQ